MNLRPVHAVGAGTSASAAGDTRAGQCLIICSDLQRSPLRSGTAVLHCAQSGTPVKCVIADICNTASNRNIRDTSASLKCMALNHALIDIGGFNRRPRKCECSNVGHTIWDCNTGNSRAAVKCTCPDAGQSASRQIHRPDAIAKIKCVITDCSHTGRNRYACNILSVFKCVIADRSHTVRNLQICHFRIIQIQMFCKLKRVCQIAAKINPAPCSEIADIHAGQSGTVLKSTDSKSGHTASHRNGIKCCTADKRRLPHKAGLDRCLLKAGTICKCRIPDR